jgi:hypothetical protein
MKKRALATVLVIVLILSSCLAANATEPTMVTVKYPDGTTVEMTLEAFQASFMPNSSPSTTTTTTVEEDTPDTVPWPSYTLTKYKLKIADMSTAKMTFSGPSRNYTEAGSYLTSKITRTDGLLVEGSYVLVEMNYTTVGLRRVYFSRGVFKNSYDVPEVALLGHPAVTTKSVSAWYGPGPMYCAFEGANVGANTELSVFFEENGYVFAEYEAGFQLVRAWINANSVKPK